MYTRFHLVNTVASAYTHFSYEDMDKHPASKVLDGNCKVHTCEDKDVCVWQSKLLVAKC